MATKSKNKISKKTLSKNPKKVNLASKEISSQISQGSLEQDISLCLVMIVKDEGDTIRKCLTQVAPYISYYVIVDTGSSDNTIDEINSTMKDLGIDGEVHERPWVNFEVNRTESLKLAKGKCDYRWIIDADDTFQVVNPKVNPFSNLPKQEVDCFQILYKLNNLQYHRAQIVRSDQDWVYKGVLHEYLDLPGKEPLIQYQIPSDRCHVDADISPLKRANTLEEKYAKDAEILEKALEDEPTNSRYMFYLAQSYRDSNQKLKAIEAYERRIEAGGWEEEVYYSMYMIGKIKEQLGRHPDEIIQAYSRAWEYRPQRLEAVFHCMRKLRERGRWVLSFTYGSMAVKNPGTSDILFVEPEVWQWRLLDEYALAAFHTGNPELAFEKMDAVVRMEFFQGLPINERERILKNLDHYRQAAAKKAEILKSKESITK
jgi:glycosyltransferase involved in cell wall biosynthesis